MLEEGEEKSVWGEGGPVRVISEAASSMSAKTERVWPETAVTRLLLQRWIGGAGGAEPLYRTHQNKWTCSECDRSL